MANILAEVIHARDATTGDEFREMLQNVNTKLQQLKTDLVDSLQSTFVLNEADIDRVTSWYVEVLGIHDKVKELQKQFHDDRKALQSATDDIDTLSEELEQCDKNVLVLEALVETVRNIEKADPSDSYKASELVKSAQTSFKSIRESFGSSVDHDWVVGLRSFTLDLLTQIYEKASKDFWTGFHVGKNSLTINFKASDFDELIKTLINIGYCSRVINKLTASLWQELLSKVCSQDYTMEVTEKSKMIPNSQIKMEPLDYEEDDTIPVRERDSIRNPSETNNSLRPVDDSLTAITMKAVKLETPITDVKVVFRNITLIIRIFHNLFIKNIDVMDDFSRVLGPRICDELGNKCLKTLILRNAEGNNNKARENIAVMKDFVEYMSSKLHFDFPQDSIFDALERDFDSLFEAQMKQDLLVKIRSLIKANLHDTQEIISENYDQRAEIPEEIAALHRSPFTFPGCIVSKSVVEMIRVLKEHLQRYPKDVVMCDAAFNLYLSLMKVPKHESEAGDLVPFSAVLIHNNSLYLAHHASYTFPMSEDKIPELRAKSTQAYSFMMRSCRTKLNSMISEAMTGIIGDDVPNGDISKFLKISAEFARLDAVFKHVLTSAMLNRTLATMVDHTVNEMCSKVLSLDDISATSANNLASAFTQFAVETSELFKGDATNSREVEALTGKCVRKWHRFRLLTFVLTASMKEIEDKWVEGCGPLAIEFKPEELRKLVRALFQNTDRRAAFLASIK